MRRFFPSMLVTLIGLAIVAMAMLGMAQSA
jgi:hypothetical protein